MKNNDLPSISALPKGENFWRIDWFGDLAFPNRLIRRTQPSLFLHLSRVLDGNFRDTPSVLLSPDSTTPAKFQRKAWVSVGTLPLLRIGDIWRDGRLEARPDYQLESFADLHIDDTTVHLIKAGLNLDDKGFLLPLSEHPWHMQCTHSYCVMVELPDDRRLIIPCVELIRFYFGSSSSLVTKLFLPPLERKALYCNPKFDKANGHLVLELAEKISGASAADIGRLHLDSVAWRAAVHIGTSALKASLAKQSVYPQSFFPFEGNTTLIAAGKWLSFGEQPQATFIVYNLRSCSHPFPYRSLRYESKDNLLGPVQGGHSELTQSAKRGHQSARDSRDQHLVEQDASNGLAPKIKQIRFEPRFPDLKKKTVWKNKSLSSPDPIQSSLASEKCLDKTVANRQMFQRDCFRDCWSSRTNREPDRPNGRKPCAACSPPTGGARSTGSNILLPCCRTICSNQKLVIGFQVCCQESLAGARQRRRIRLEESRLASKWRCAKGVGLFRRANPPLRAWGLDWCPPRRTACPYPPRRTAGC